MAGTTQITVRIPSELVSFLDDLVARGEADSRAAAVTRGLRRYEQHLGGLRDAEIYRTTGPDPELEAWARWSTEHPVDLSDLD